MIGSHPHEACGTVTGQRRGLHSDPREAIRVALKNGADRRWLGAYLDLPDRLAFAADNTEARFFQARVQSNVMLLNCSSPSCKRRPNRCTRLQIPPPSRLSRSTGFSKPD